MTDIKIAINWDKSQVCLEEALVIDQLKVRKSKIKKTLYKNYNLIIILTFLVFMTVSIALIVTGSIGLMVFGIAGIVSSIIAFSIAFCPKWMLNAKIENIDKESVYTEQFIRFANAMYELRSYIGTPSDFYYLNEHRNPHMMYKLFNLVNRYADQDFRKAYANYDAVALTNILTPFMKKNRYGYC